ncbi:MAG TPA: TfoX/Sxy family protein [Sedimentisphaerales bacterium]|nr:TfoX/Sxy family protein [Sedimentisphaerales bacterium]
MAVSDEFVDYVVEQLSGWGEVSVRRMFGGAGLCREGIMFAVVADDVAYLKVDDSNCDDFLRAGSAPFEPYPDKIKTTIRTCFEIPADVLEDPDELARWAQRSWIVARKKKETRRSL